MFLCLGEFSGHRSMLGLCIRSARNFWSVEPLGSSFLLPQWTKSEQYPTSPSWRTWTRWCPVTQSSHWLPSTSHQRLFFPCLASLLLMCPWLTSPRASAHTSIASGVALGSTQIKTNDTTCIYKSKMISKFVLMLGQYMTQLGHVTLWWLNPWWHH